MLYFVLFLILTLSLLVWILFFIVSIWKYKQLPVILKGSSKKSFGPQPLASVIIPSKNEARKIGECIKRLKVQTYTNLEFIIVDDSEDDTIEVINRNVGKDNRFKIIKQNKLPPEWVGKPHALQQGSTIAKGDWLVFIDADTEHDPELIERALEYSIKNKLDMLSVLPQIICKSFWEKIIQPIPAGLMLFFSPLNKVNNQESKATAASGPFIMIKHSVFNEVGGYEKIKGYIADDAEMARLIKHSGFKIGLVNGQTLAKVRMYEHFKEIWEGWSKNIFLGLVQRKKIQSKKLFQLLAIIFGAIAIFTIVVLPFLTMIISLILTVLINQLQWRYLFIFSSIIWFFATITQFCVSKLYYIGDPKYVPLIFLGGIFFIGIFINSGIKTLSGKGVNWKGRKYSTGE